MPRPTPMSSLLQFVPVTTPAQFEVVAALAREIWDEYYVPLIGRAQVDYMVSKFQSSGAMAGQVREGYEYFLTERDGRSIGYCARRARSESTRSLRALARPWPRCFGISTPCSRPGRGRSTARSTRPRSRAQARRRPRIAPAS